VKNGVPILVVDGGEGGQQVQHILANATHLVIRKSCVYADVHGEIIARGVRGDKVWGNCALKVKVYP